MEATLVLDEVEVTDEDVLAEDAAQTLRRHAVAGLCLFGDGVVAGARDLTAEYVKGRRQFGRALAEFQAVSAQMADVYIASRTIGLAATSAAWRLASGLDPDDDLAVAAYWFAAEAPKALHTCHHLHGGMGVDVTYPLHAYFSWTKDISRALGGEHQTLEAVSARGLGRG
jgi:alkylation response protein AidB-like acyl-CoA dehydrogenase